MNSSSTNGEQPLPPTSEPPPLHGLRHTMLNAETVQRFRPPLAMWEPAQTPGAGLYRMPDGQVGRLVPVTDRQERELYRASFRRRIQEPLRARRRGWCATPPLD